MGQFEGVSEESFAAKTLKPPKSSLAMFVAENARYDARSKAIRIDLTNGISTIFPIDKLPGLAGASAEDLRKITIEGCGYGLHIPALDVDISVAQLFADYLDSHIMTKNIARLQASRANGRLGGRPRKNSAA